MPNYNMDRTYYYDRNELHIPMYIVTERLGLSSPLPGSPDPFSFSDINALENSLSRVWFKDIHNETLLSLLSLLCPSMSDLFKK